MIFFLNLSSPYFYNQVMSYNSMNILSSSVELKFNLLQKLILVEFLKKQ